jgi:hypothetical protein
MAILGKLKLFSEKYLRKTEAAWRRRVYEARTPGVLYHVADLHDPKAIYVDYQWQDQWRN